MGRKKRPASSVDGQQPQQPHAPQLQQQPQQPNGKKARTNQQDSLSDDPELTGERYSVKKYRADKFYPAMDAFVKYTKSHRMLDAAYIRWKTGVTTEKPHVYSTRVGGIDLGWGRGKTREAAMDCACRAAFALVSAHGYNNFPLDDDCLDSKPVPAVSAVPPPPPPPPPPMPMFGGLPPPPGTAPPPPPPPAMMTDLIPQAQVGATTAPVATSLSTTSSIHTPVTGAATTSAASVNNVVTPAEQLTEASATTPSTGISLQFGAKSSPSSAASNLGTKNKVILKGGLTLVYDSGEGDAENCMEESRMALPRYNMLVSSPPNTAKAVSQLPCLSQ